MQLWAYEEREDEWTTCSGGVLLAGFRGVEISYNARDVCVDSFNPLPPRDGYRKPLLVGPSIRKTMIGELRARIRHPWKSIWILYIFILINDVSSVN